MRKIKISVLALAICMFGLFAAGCGKTINFDYNIDFIVDGKTVSTVGTNGDTISMPGNPVKEDYTFEGWFWDDGKWEEPFTLNSIMDQPLQDKNHYKVYAKFKSTVYYTVVFCDSDDKITQEIKYGEETPLRINTFTRENYIFDGWRCGSDTYEDGESVLNLCEAGEEIRLTAKWKYIDPIGYYTITFDSNGGEGAMNDVDARPGSSVFLPYNKFTREYYVFDCWNTDPLGNGQRFSDGAVINEDIAGRDQTVTLYAIWELDSGVYMIENPEDMLSVRNDLGGTYVMTRDLDFDGKILNEFPLATDSAFHGVFDGRGFVIRNLSISQNPSLSRYWQDSLSIFGYNEGTIKNLGIENSEIKGDGYSNGAIFANTNDGLIENCYAKDCTVRVSDNGQTVTITGAGIVAHNFGHINNCYFTGSIYAKITDGVVVGLGGIASLNQYAISNCFSYINIMFEKDGNDADINRMDAIMGFADGDAVKATNNFCMKYENYIYWVPFGTTTGNKITEVSSKYAQDMTNIRNSASFYTNTLGWSDKVWDFSKVSQSLLPTLIKKG